MRQKLKEWIRELDCDRIIAGWIGIGMKVWVRHLLHGPDKCVVGGIHVEMHGQFVDLVCEDATPVLSFLQCSKCYSTEAAALAAAKENTNSKGKSA